MKVGRELQLRHPRVDENGAMPRQLAHEKPKFKQNVVSQGRLHFAARLYDIVSLRNGDSEIRFTDRSFESLQWVSASKEHAFAPDRAENMWFQLGAQIRCDDHRFGR